MAVKYGCTCPKSRGGNHRVSGIHYISGRIGHMMIMVNCIYGDMENMVHKYDGYGGYGREFESNSCDT